MNSTHLKLISAVATAAVLTPAVAGAANTDLRLGGQPTLSRIDAHHASLRFAADRLPKKAGKPNAKITFAGGQKVGALKAVGTHGSDIVYHARVTSTSEFRSATKYTVTITLPGSAPDKRLVKLRG
jgi:hypothetical protein